MKLPFFEGKAWALVQVKFGSIAVTVNSTVGSPPVVALADWPTCFTTLPRAFLDGDAAGDGVLVLAAGSGGTGVGEVWLTVDEPPHPDKSTAAATIARTRFIVSASTAGLIEERGLRLQRSRQRQPNDD